MYGIIGGLDGWLLISISVMMDLQLDGFIEYGEFTVQAGDDITLM